MAERDDCCELQVVGRAPRTTCVRGIDPRTFARCYLCHRAISEAVSRDHVPPKQFFPKAFRTANATDQLEWLPTHPACNKSYQLDEDYFVTTFGLASARSTFGGHALAHDIRDRYRAGGRQGLVRKVLAEFVPSSNQKAFDVGRTNRVAWKIVRGLHCLRTGELLPETARLGGGFDCSKTSTFVPALEAAMRANGYDDPWEGTLPDVFKTKIMVDVHADRQTYGYLMVCWNYVSYYITFDMHDGSLLQGPNPST